MGALRDILIASIVCGWFPLMVIDPDGSIWRNDKRLKQVYEIMVLDCLKGKGFAVSTESSGTAVMCYPVDVYLLGRQPQKKKYPEFVYVERNF